MGGSKQPGDKARSIHERQIGIEVAEAEQQHESFSAAGTGDSSYAYRVFLG